MAGITADDTRYAILDFGEAATYTPQGGAAVTTTVLLKPDVEVYSSDIGSMRNADTIVLLREDIDRPVRNAAIVIAAGTYIVQELLKRNPFTAEVLVEKDNS